MLPELGHFALILALCMAILQSVPPLIGVYTRSANLVALARPAAQLQLLFISISMFCLGYAFVVHDFSVAYVANNSNTALPLLFRISAIWGAHEGSLLLWALILAIWTNLLIIFSKSLPTIMRARVIAVVGLISIGFILFMLLTSNPFDRLFQVPIEGRDLNPLLQDFGLAVHPPMLYMGYVGLVVPFSLAIAAMLGGGLDAAWARWSRPWTTMAWLFLTLGIALGSWWAYYELGWGGWWFWDPVENASFMPWLFATALLHSLAVTEKRHVFKAWTVLLAIFAFSLSLLGTFLVRSGVLTSVHAFATDPERGVFILIFLVIVIGGSLSLYAWRAPKIKSSAQFKLFSKETALLLNNIVLVVTGASILLGTLYPLVLDALGVGKISVGPPYFNTVFIPLMMPLAVLIGIGVFMRWKEDSATRLWKLLRGTVIASVVISAIVVAMLPDLNPMAIAGMSLAVWIVCSNVFSLWQRLGGNVSNWKKVPSGFYGMTIAHMGAAVFVVGITLTSLYSEEKDVRLVPGESHTLGGYEFKFNGVEYTNGANYRAARGDFKVMKDGEVIALLNPEKRTYRVQTMPMTEAAIDQGFTRDLFIALGEPLDKTQFQTTGAWSVRLYYKPFIRWIWAGAVFMALGGLFGVFDPRYRKLKVRKTVKVKPAASMDALKGTA